MTELAWLGACETNTCAEVFHDKSSGEILLRSNRNPDVHISLTRQEWEDLLGNPFFKTI